MRLRSLLFVTYVTSISFPTISAKTPLYVGAMFPMTSLHNDSWAGGAGILPAAQMAIDHVNTAGVLNDYNLTLIWNDTRVT